MTRNVRSLDQAILDTVLDGIVTIDGAGVIRHVNPACERLFGFRDDEMVGQNVSMLMPEPYRSEHDTYLEHYHSTGAANIIGIGREVEAKRKDGSCFPVYLTIGEWHDDATDERLFVGVVRDVSAIEAAERGIRMRERRLREVWHELDELTSLVSHNLRGSLHVIDGFAQVVLQDCGDALDTEGVRLMNVIRGRVEIMDQQIDCLLSFSQLARMELKYTRVDMTALVREVLDLLVARVPERSIEAHVGELPEAWADASLMRQVWEQLLDNAIKYTRGRTPTRIDIIGLRHKDRYIYTIQDNGVGFDMKHARKLFRIFQRLHKPTEFEGVGVGLAQVHRIVARHSGEVWAESRLGEGAAFHIALPASSSATIGRTEAPASESAEARHRDPTSRL